MKWYRVAEIEEKEFSRDLIYRRIRRGKIKGYRRGQNGIEISEVEYQKLQEEEYIMQNWVKLNNIKMQVSYNTVKHWCGQGVIPYRVIKGATYIPPEVAKALATTRWEYLREYRLFRERCMRRGIKPISLPLFISLLESWLFLTKRLLLYDHGQGKIYKLRLSISVKKRISSVLESIKDA